MKLLPDLCWGTVFGLPYIELFGRDELFSCGAYLVREVRPDKLYVQLTEKMEGAVLNSDEFALAQESVKRRLNKNAFLDPQAPPGHIYNAPTFGNRLPQP